METISVTTRVITAFEGCTFAVASSKNASLITKAKIMVDGMTGFSVGTSGGALTFQMNNDAEIRMVVSMLYSLADSMNKNYNEQFVNGSYKAVEVPS